MEVEVEQLRPQPETARARQMAVRGPNKRFKAGTGSLGGRGELQEDSKTRNLPTDYRKRARQSDTNLISQKSNRQGAAEKNCQMTSVHISALPPYAVSCVINFCI